MLYLRMGIIAGLILIGVIIYTVIALNRQKNEAEAKRKKQEFKGREKNDSQESKIPDNSREEEDARDLRK